MPCPREQAFSSRVPAEHGRMGCCWPSRDDRVCRRWPAAWVCDTPFPLRALVSVYGKFSYHISPAAIHGDYCRLTTARAIPTRVFSYSSLGAERHATSSGCNTRRGSGHGCRSLAGDGLTPRRQQGANLCDTSSETCSRCKHWNSSYPSHMSRDRIHPP